MNYKISKEAERDLEKNWLYTIDSWSIEQAERHLNSIFEEIGYLCNHPNSGVDFGKVRKGYWRSKVKSHLIFYKTNFKSNQIEVIRVLHEMMDIEHQL